jgi:hypothetical protein
MTIGDGSSAGPPATSWFRKRESSVKSVWPEEVHVGSVGARGRETQVASTTINAYGIGVAEAARLIARERADARAARSSRPREER